MGSIQDERGYNQGYAPTTAQNIRIQRRAQFIADHIPVNPLSPCSVLEIGCGTGELSYHISENPQLEVIATDLSALFINSASQKYHRPNLKYLTLDFNRTADVHALTGQTQFNAIVGNGILHHLYPQLNEHLRVMKNLLAPGGRLIFMEPNLLNPFCFFLFQVPFLRKIGKLEPDEMAFSLSFITHKLQSLDFQSVHVSYKDFLLPITPRALIKPSILIGDILEKSKPTSWLAQSLLIVAQNTES